MMVVYRVYSTYPASWGIDKFGIRLFRGIGSARCYAGRLAAGAASDALGTDDVLTVEVEDVAAGEVVEFWQFQGESVAVFRDDVWDEFRTCELVL